MIDECPHAEAHEPHIFGRLLTDGDELVLGAPLSCGGMTGTEAALARDPELMARIELAITSPENREQRGRPQRKEEPQ